MEIKTCEHFIVNRLMELENKVASYETLIDAQKILIQDLEEKVAYARDLIIVHKARDYTPENPKMYIDMDTVWNIYNKAKFDELCDVFGLSLPSDEEEE